jgi:hypothetical protein
MHVPLFRSRRVFRHFAGGFAALALWMLVGCGGSNTGRAPAPAPGPQPGSDARPGPAPATDLYELDPAKHVIPAAPATGRLQGKPFTPDRVELEGDKLTLRSGKDFFPDQEVAILLGDKAKPADGLKLVVKPTQKWTDGIPSLHVATRSGDALPDTKFVNDDYSLTLELGKPDKGKVPGKIYLCLPDSQRSHLAGTFVAQRKRSLSDPPGEDDVPFIQGSVSPPAKKDQMVNVGYVGRTADGTVISDGAGTKPFGEGGGGARSASFAPRTAGLRLEKFTPHFDFTNLPPGRYLVFARYESGAAAWAWADVAAGGKVTANLTLDEAKVGTVAVKVPAGAGDARLVPSDLGTPPPDDRFLDQLAFSLNLKAEAKDGAATAKVPAGKYQVRAANLRADVEVTAGKTATVELKPAKN